MKTFLTLIFLTLCVSSYAQENQNDPTTIIIYKDTSDFQNIRNKIKDQTFFIKLDSNDVNVYIRRSAKSESKDYNGAITDLNKAISLNPGYSKVYANRGFNKRNLGLYKDAITDYNKALELNLDYSEVYLNRGYAKFNLKDYDGAIKDYTRALQIEPAYESFDFYNSRGQAYEKKGDLENAKLDFQKAESLKNK